MRIDELPLRSDAKSATMEPPAIGDLLAARWKLDRHSHEPGLLVTQVRDVCSLKSSTMAPVCRWELTLRGNGGLIEEGLGLGYEYFIKKPSLVEHPVRVQYVEEFRKANGDIVIQVVAK